MLAREFDELGGAKAVVAHLDGMPDFTALDPFGQQREKAREILAVEFLGRGELPVDRTELVAEFEHAAGEKTPYRLAGFSKNAPVGGKARALDRKNKVVGRFSRHS